MWIDPPRLAPVTENEGSRPRVSVVMPTFRRPHQVGASVRSLLAQKLSDFELLVRDDGDGHDGTREAVQEAAGGDPRVRYHRNPDNLRMPGNVNAGISASRGHLIAICHDHDLYKPDFLAGLAELLDRHPSALYAHCAIESIEQDGRVRGAHVGDWPELTPGPEWMDRLLQRFSCPVSALSMVRRSAHERFGLYNPICGFIADVELWIRLAEAGDVAYSATPLVQVMDRESDHDATVNPWPILATTVSIHRHYIYRHYSGVRRMEHEVRLSMRADSTIIKEVLNRVRHRQWSGFGVHAASLAEAAGPFGRALIAFTTIASSAEGRR